MTKADFDKLPFLLSREEFMRLTGLGKNTLRELRSGGRIRAYKQRMKYKYYKGDAAKLGGLSDWMSAPKHEEALAGQPQAPTTSLVPATNGRRTAQAGSLRGRDGVGAEKLFPVWESSFAARLGLSRKVVSAARAQLVRGLDWTSYARRVCLTLEAAGKLSRQFGLRAGKEAAAVISAAIRNSRNELALDACIVFRVHPRNCANPHILLCSDGHGGLVQVKVKSKEKFRPGMQVRCTKLREGLYQLVGNHPRFVGKY